MPGHMWVTEAMGGKGHHKKWGLLLAFYVLGTPDPRGQISGSSRSRPVVSFCLSTRWYLGTLA